MRCYLGRDAAEDGEVCCEGFCGCNRCSVFLLFRILLCPLEELHPFSEPICGILLAAAIGLPCLTSVCVRFRRLAPCLPLSRKFSRCGLQVGTVPAPLRRVGWFIQQPSTNSTDFFCYFAHFHKFSPNPGNFRNGHNCIGVTAFYRQFVPSCLFPFVPKSD